MNTTHKLLYQFMIDHRYCVILAGGIGTRFWPISREYRPKQFQKIWGRDKTFLQETFGRMNLVFPADHILVATLDRYKTLVMEQLPELPEANIITEPYGRNTAPTIAFSARILLEKDSEAIMVATPSDHHISDYELFCDTLRTAMEYAEGNDVLLTLGVVPTRPDTSFGYIQVTGGPDAYGAGTPVKAKTFTEKPDPELAKVFVDSGEFLWNSGLFIWKASVVLDEMAACCPELDQPWDGWKEVFGTPEREAFIERAYAGSTRISIDYALMEKSDKVWILPSKFGWRDIGSWATLFEFSRLKDLDENIVEVNGQKIVRDCSKSMIYCDDNNKLTIVSSLENYMVIDTDKVLMVCPRDEKRLQEIMSQLALPEYSDFK